MNEPPGSPEAIQHGCRCAVIDNCYGKGAFERNGEPVYWVSADCPLHGGQHIEAWGNEHE